LETHACECYGVVKKELNRLLSDVQYRQDKPAAADGRIRPTRTAGASAGQDA
jgi:hypothetical protein